MKFLPWQCCINLEQKTDLIPLNICQGFNVVDNITSTIRPGITIPHFYPVPRPVAAGRALPGTGLRGWTQFLFMDPTQALELPWVSQLLFPCSLNQLCSLPADWKCCYRNISITFLLTGIG